MSDSGQRLSPLLQGSAPRQGEPSRAARSLKRQQEGLGTSYLGSGLNGIAAAILLYEFLVFASTVDSYARPALVGAAWILLAVAFGATVVAVRFAGQRLPTPAYLVLLLGITGAVVLDLIAVVEQGSPGTGPTVAVAAAVVHAPMIVHRNGLEVITVALVIAVAELIAFAMVDGGDATASSMRISAIVMTVAPAIVLVVMMRGFRRMVQVEIDRALAHSAAVGPQYAVGMLASEELARLDLAAERLLAEVGDGTVDLPLDDQRAAHAASLATQLRLHLIEGRRETWLHHAILESEVLAPLVDLDDPDGSAGLLDHEQRDGLLSAVWLIVDSAAGLPVVLHVEAGAPRRAAPHASERGLLVPVTLRSEGVPLRGVDPAAWEAIAQVGAFRDSSRDGELRIEIDCLVENPADR